MIPTLALAALMDAGAASAVVRTPSPSPLQQRIDQVIDRALHEKRIVGAVVLVALHGQLVYHRAAGYADRETRTPMREDTVFRLSSVTKPIVAVAFMRLVEQGRVKLDDPVTRWLPDFTPSLPDGSKPIITLGELLNHSAGLGYGFLEPVDGPYHQLGISDGIDQSGISLDENLRRLAKAPLYFKPGSEWRYSLGIDVIGAVIERVTHQSLPHAVAELVTKPLGMRDTAFIAHDPSRLATPYAEGKPEPVRMTDNMEVPLPEELGGHSVRFAPSRALDASAYPSGGAGMVGTASDVLHLLETVRQGGGKLLSRATIAEMAAPSVGEQAQTAGPGWGYGYGWAVLVDPSQAQTPQGRGTLQWGGVYGHNWFIDPTHELSVVLLTDTAYEGMVGPLTVELRDAVYGHSTHTP
jgi:CubicO group peptidase (beta-lactamase class C family)